MGPRRSPPSPAPPTLPASCPHRPFPSLLSISPLPMVSWVPSHDPTSHQPDRRPPDHKGDQHPSTVASRWMWMVQGGYGGCGDRLCSSFISAQAFHSSISFYLQDFSYSGISKSNESSSQVVLALMYYLFRVGVGHSATRTQVR